MLERSTCQIFEFNKWGVQQTVPAIALSDVTSPLGKRLVALSLALQEELLDDDTILDYLEEMTQACNRELKALPTQALHLSRTVSGLRSYLVGMLELADSFEEYEHEHVVRKVYALEGELHSALVTLYTQEVA